MTHPLRDAVISVLVDAGIPDAASVLEVPPDSSLGDFAVPCFSLASAQRKPPVDIARALAVTLAENPLFMRVEARGPYVNMTLAPARWSAAALSQDDTFPKREGTVLIEYSSPNIGKPFGIHHLRSTMIGNALDRIYTHAGYTVLGLNHLGDWGNQYGKLIVAFQRWGEEDALLADPIQHLLALYVRFHEMAEQDVSLEREARDTFKRLERGDPEVRAIWQRFRDLSLVELNRTYARLGVSFDNMDGEAFYEPFLPDVVAALTARGLLEESEGAHIVPLENLPPAVVLRNDGATLYITRDIAAAIRRYETWPFEKLLYVVDARQSLHFQQLFAVLQMLGHDWVSRCAHVPFGIMRFTDKNMSTRKGDVVFMEAVLDEARARALALITEKNPALPDKEAVAEMVGVGAVVFHDLKNDRVKDVVFDWELMMSVEGETGPYVQYTHARLRSVLRKASHPVRPDASVLIEPEFVLVCKELLSWDAVFAQVLRQDRPHILARHLLSVAQAVNTAYERHRVLVDDPHVQGARLALLARVADRLRVGLSLLGIQAPEAI